MENLFWKLFITFYAAASIFPLYGVPLSLIIWYRTKDPNNRWLKFLYRCRVAFGIFVIIYTMAGVANVFTFTADADLRFFLGLPVNTVYVWALMRVWVKKTPEPE